MKIKSNISYMLFLILMVTVFLCGCGNDNRSVSGQKGTDIKQEETTYVAQVIPIPEYDSFDGAYSDGNTLYYAAAEFNEVSSKYLTSFYTFKQGATTPEKNFTLAENQRVQNMTMDKDGNTYYLGYEEPSAESANGPITDTILYKVDSKGTVILTLNLSEYTKGQEPSMIQDLAVDKENHMIFCDSMQNIYVLTPDGNLLIDIRADGMIYDLCNNGEKVFIAHSGIAGVEIRELDIPARKLSSNLINNIPGAQFHIASNKNGTLLIASGESVYKYIPETEETVKMFDWHTYDFTGIAAGLLLPYGETNVLVISRDYSSFPMKSEATIFRQAAEGEVIAEEKTILTLGIPRSLSGDRGKSIAAFNKANPNYKIELKNYEEDYTRLSTEIIAGKGPDILALPSYHMNLLAEKGVLEDLNPYFDNDRTLNRSDYPENILKAFETEGHLYVIPITFQISTMVGKTSLLGEYSKWNLDELITFVENSPEETPVFDNTSKSGVLRLLKYAYTRQLVDRNNAENPLNRELLIKMLTFANRYENDDKYVHEVDKLSWKILSEQVMLPDVVVSGGHSYFTYSSMFGEPITFIGYSTEEGNGSLIISNNTYAINSSSEYKDVAWEFISTLLSEKEQKTMVSLDFPLKKDVLEYFATYLIGNATRNVVISASKIGDSDYSSSVTVYEFPPGDTVREEDIQQIYNLIQNADTAVHISPDIDKIILEEAVLYFNGTKPMEEVVDVIENRIRTYVNENN